MNRFERIPFDMQYAGSIEAGEYGVETRDGGKVRILCFDAKTESGYPIIALVKDSENKPEYIVSYTFRGTVDSESNPLDLFLVRTKKKSIKEKLDEYINSVPCDEREKHFKEFEDWYEEHFCQDAREEDYGKNIKGLSANFRGGI